MRITNNMMISNMIRNLGNNQSRLSKYQDQLDTGKKISVPSDDPVVAARALKLRTDVAKVEQYQKNIDDSESWLDLTETALAEVGDVLQRARELTNQAANSTNTPGETQKIAEEIKQLKIQIVHLSNSTYAGRYIFSGFKTDQKLINDDENSPDFGKFNLTVNTINEKIFYEIGTGDSMNLNIAGGDLFNMGGNAENPTNGISTSKINTITYPYTIDASNSAVNITVDGNDVSANIPAGDYNDAESLSAAIKTAVNAQIDVINAGIPAGDPLVLPVDVSISGDQLELRTTSKTAASEIKIKQPASNFFSSVNVTDTDTVETTGDAGEMPSMIKMFNDLLGLLEKGDNTGISAMLDSVDEQINNVLRIRADVGARQNRLELTSNRMDLDYINFTKLMSNNEDVDVAETIMNLKNEENVYNASLAGGARIIQPSLVDFLK